MSNRYHHNQIRDISNISNIDRIRYFVYHIFSIEFDILLIIELIENHFFQIQRLSGIYLSFKKFYKIFIFIDRL